VDSEVSVPVLQVTLSPEQIEELADLITARIERSRPSPAPDRWMQSAEAAAYLGLSLHSLHRLTSSRLLPFSQDTPGGKCFFKRSKLDAWRESNQA
jgi:excisionase family DNA binding protein